RVFCCLLSSIDTIAIMSPRRYRMGKLFILVLWLLLTDAIRPLARRQEFAHGAGATHRRQWCFPLSTRWITRIFQPNFTPKRDRSPRCHSKASALALSGL